MVLTQMLIVSLSIGISSLLVWIALSLLPERFWLSLGLIFCKEKYLSFYLDDCECKEDLKSI